MPADVGAVEDAHRIPMWIAVGLATGQTARSAAKIAIFDADYFDDSRVSVGNICTIGTLRIRRQRFISIFLKPPQGC
jgi:hypothetical protein